MDPLDRELAEAININPSPEFTARVRMRVASERAPRMRVSVLSFASAGMATIAVVLAVWTLRERTNGRSAQGRVQVATTASAHTVEQPPPDRVRVPAIPVRSAAVRPRGPSVQVIVAADEVRGLRRLSEMARNGVVLTFPGDADRDDSTLSPPPLMHIAVTPIEIAPLTVASTIEEGDAQ